MLWKSFRSKPGSAPLTVMLVLYFSCTSIAAQEVAPPSDLIELTPEDLRESMIAFVNLSTAPGLAGATFSVDEPGRESELIRGSLGYAADLTLKDYVLDAYWGAALAYGGLEDQLDVLDADGRPTQLNVDRNILSLRGSAGLSLPITQHFTLRPYLSLAASRLETNSQARGLDSVSVLPQLWLDTEVDAMSTSLTLEAAYDRWFDSGRLEIGGQYTAAYTDTFNGSIDSLNTWGWNETALARVRYSDATNWFTRSKPWRWNTYATHTRFIGLDPQALGFSAYTEVGVGLDFEVNIRPLDWFGLRFIGLKAGYIFGDGVDGFSVGLSF
jgi:hypothetical protein